LTVSTSPARLARAVRGLLRGNPRPGAEPAGAEVTGEVDGLSDGRLTAWVRSPAREAEPELRIEQPGTEPLRLSPAGERADPPGARRFVLADVGDALLLQLLAGEAEVRWCCALPEARGPLGGLIGLSQGFRCAALARLQARLAEARAAAVPKPREIWGRVLQPAPPAPAGGQPVSKFDFIEGLVSLDESTIVGKEGFLFLYRGTNDLLEQYEPRPQDAETAARWVALIAKRRGFVRAAGPTFLQMLIPEKTSSLSHLLPFSIKAPTRLSSLLREGMAAAAVPDFLDVAALMPVEGAAEWWRRTDSHLSTLGCLRVFQGVLGHLGLEAPEVPLVRRTTLQGDIGMRFPGLVDVSWEPEEVGPFAAKPDIRIEHPRGGNQGTEVTSHNPDAPVARRVLVFGNSYFGQPTGPQYLSWWFTRWFRDFHFHWKGNLDPAVMAQLQPDHVICQTIERFLPVVPNR